MKNNIQEWATFCCGAIPYLFCIRLNLKQHCLERWDLSWYRIQLVYHCAENIEQLDYSQKTIS